MPDVNFADLQAQAFKEQQEREAREASRPAWKRAQRARVIAEAQQAIRDVCDELVARLEAMDASPMMKCRRRPSEAAPSSWLAAREVEVGLVE
jgi:hypothetical protein